MSIYLNPSEWNLKTDGGIPYKLMNGYPTGSIDDEGSFTTTEAYIMEASSLSAFITESFSPTVYTPTRHMPGQSYNYTRSISFEPFPEGLPGDPFGAHVGIHDENTFAQFVKVTIQYKQGEEQDGADPSTFVEIAADASVEVLVTSSEAMKWESGQPIIEVDLPIGHLCPMTEWTARWPRIPQTYINTIAARLRQYMGCINSTPMTKLYGAEAGTILFSGLSFQQAFIYGGGPAGASIEAKLLEKRLVKRTEAGTTVYGHNHYYNKKTGLYERIKKTDGSFIYPEANLNLLF